MRIVQPLHPTQRHETKFEECPLILSAFASKPFDTQRQTCRLTKAAQMSDSTYVYVECLITSVSATATLT